MLLFLYNNFKLNLTHLRVTFNEINPWLQEELSSEYSFPFNIPVDEWAKFADFTNYNASNLQTSFLGKLYRDGEILDATLKVQEHKGDNISGIIYAGLDGISVLDVQLNELPLEKFPVADLKAHAAATIVQNYPAVNYNFPMVHTDKYDPTSEEFHEFEKVLNKYVGGTFVQSELKLDTNIDSIKNIMQPLPYLMYVFKKGFEHFGFELKGDILDDQDYRRAVIFRDGEYYNSSKREAIQMTIKVTEWVEEIAPLNYKRHVKYIKEITVDRKGDYIITGDYTWLYYWGSNLNPDPDETFPDVGMASNMLFMVQKFTGGTYQNLYGKQVNGETFQVIYNGQIQSESIDINVSLNAGDKIVVTKIEPKRDSVPSETPDYPEAGSITVTPIRFRNPDNTPVLSVLDLKEIDLARVVPDMSFTDLIGILRKWKNYGFVVTGNTVTMDLLSNSLDRTKAVDLSNFDIEAPTRTFYDERSFELAFTDGNNHETYKYDSMFVSRKGVLTNKYSKNKNTTAINIDALYYPVIDREGTTTAFAFDDESSKLRLLFYRAMPEAGRPVSFENLNLSIPNIYAAHYANWLNLRVTSIGYQWDFIVSVEKFKEIKMQSLIYAYKNYHLLTEVEKERITQSYWRITAKSESL